MTGDVDFFTPKLNERDGAVENEARRLQAKAGVVHCVTFQCP